MKKLCALITVTGLLVCAMPSWAFAAAKKPDDLNPSVGIEADDDADVGETAEQPHPEDNIITTKHEAVIQGETVSYTAETGTMVLESGGYECEIFYTAYLLDDVENPSERPITFAFNGGPGASSFYLNFGCLGPRRAEIDEKGYAKTLPAQIVDNENSVLDMTDLVFIDPVGTGYSRAFNEDETGEFLGYDNDIRSVGDFIRQYINRKKRWGSKKYIAGESYGTTRAVGVCDYLVDNYSMFINGLMLVSSINDFSSVMGGIGNEKPYVTYIPTYAADAWYHGRLSKEYQDMELDEYLNEVRSFVEDELEPALFIGRKISKERKDGVAEKLAGYIGLSKEYILEKNLRIDLDDFMVELLSDEKLVIGRYDGRITGPVMSGDPTDDANDPSSSSTDIALVNTYQQYVTDELGYETDTPFIPLNLEVNNKWWGYPESNPAQEEVVYAAMSKNPFLKIWVLCGYYDAATPFYAAETVYNHVFLSDDRQDNLQFTYYPSGHMIYMEKDSFDKFRKDAEDWYR